RAGAARCRQWPQGAVLALSRARSAGRVAARGDGADRRDGCQLMTSPAADSAIVSVRDLEVGFQTTDRRATVKAVDGVSFDVRRGETFGIIGESGSGKTTIGRALVFLLKPSAGTILHDG